MMATTIPFNKPFLAGEELASIQDLLKTGPLSCNGEYSARCQQWLESFTGAKHVLLTNSCTQALEMAAILLNIGPGDEVIMPSYTFVSTANAFVLRGATPVFVDIREDTLNINEQLIEQAITPNTKAIVAVHYAGVACDMDALSQISQQYNIPLVEDAAQGLSAYYKNQHLGTFGQLGTLSFHETKNVISGQGGALLINDEKLIERARIIWQKGTNRDAFISGQVDKYTWVDVGSSFAMTELSAAFLYAQLPHTESITQRRQAIWHHYHQKFSSLEKQEYLRRPIVPALMESNAHIFYLLITEHNKRDTILSLLRDRGVDACFHYIPLHSTEYGAKVGRMSGKLSVTESIYNSLVRLPLWAGMTVEEGQITVKAVIDSAPD